MSSFDATVDGAQDLLKEAEAHFNKLEQSLKYHEGRLTSPEVPDKIKNVIKREIAAIQFVMQEAREGLAAKGVNL